MTRLDDLHLIIPASTRRQAMDWSLALISQGIEAVIEPTEDGWGLVIESKDHERALETIVRYRSENRGWAWHRKLSWPPFSFHFGVAVWCLFLGILYGISTRPGSGLQDAGAMDSLAVSKGAWWRLFTATGLHADLAHLATNLTSGFCILGLAMGRFGPGVALLAAYLAGAGGNVLGLALHAEPYRGVGASGMVMGSLGLLATQTLTFRRRGPIPAKYVATGIAAAVMLFVLLGLDPKSDVAAHLGGLLVGGVIGCCLALIPHGKLQSPPINAFAGALLLAFFILTWVVALR